MIKSPVRYRILDQYLELVSFEHDAGYGLQALVKKQIRDPIQVQVHNQIRNAVVLAIEATYMNTLLQADGSV